MNSRLILSALLVAALIPCPALPCSLCANLRQSPTFRQEAARPTSRLLLHGTLENPVLKGDPAGSGTTDLRVRDVLRADPTLPPSSLRKRGDVVTLPHYVPVDPKTPAHVLVFLDADRQGLKLNRVVSLTSERTAEYVRVSLELADRDPKTRLSYCFSRADDPDPLVAHDAFMELAQASDADIGDLGRTLKPEPIRRRLEDRTTPPERLSLYGFLLGACGTKDDAALLHRITANPGERYQTSCDGVLAGLIQLRPREGWELAEKVLGDKNRSVVQRLSFERTLRFYMAWRPTASREPVKRCLAAMLAHGELVDLAAEDLRRWKMWELTPQVLALYGRKGLEAPIQRNAILRYALCCPVPEARRFVADLRRRDEALVNSVEEALRAIDEK